MHARCALFGPTDVQNGAIEIDLIPTKVHRLGGTQPMPKADQDEGGVPVTVSYTESCIAF